MLGGVRLQKARGSDDLTKESTPELVASIAERHPDDGFLTPTPGKDMLDAD